MKIDWGTIPDEQLRTLKEQLGDWAQVATTLGVPRTTLSDEVGRRGLREIKQTSTPFGHVSLGVSAYGDAAEIPVIRRKYDADSHRAYPLGDVHLGAREHKAAQWAEWLGYLNDHPDASMLGTGDFLNTALKDSVSDVYEETLTIPKATRLLRGQLAQLAEENRIDVLIPGNHENRITKSTGICPIEDVAEFLEVPYAPAAVLLVYEVGDQEYTLFLRHGTGNGQSVAATEKSSTMIHADIYVTGHTHAQFAKTDEVFVLAPDGLSTVRRRRYYVSAGSFMGLEKYAAERGYKATRIGAPRIFMDGTRHDIHVSL